MRRNDEISRYIRRILKSKDGRVLVSNFGYLSLLQIAGYVFPLITMPYLARVIGADGFGKIAFASAIIVWVQTIADWGFNLTATRDVARNRDDKEFVSRIFSNVFWARCFLTVICGLLLGVLICIVPYLRENAFVIIITFLLVPGHILFPEWFFQALEKMKYTTIFNLLIKLLFTIAVFVFIHDKDDYIIQPLLTTIGYLLCGVCSFCLILRRWKFKLYKPNWIDVFATIKNSTDVFLNNLMPNLYNSFSVMLLGFWGGFVANGIYDGGNKIPTIFYQLQSVLSRCFFPFLSRKPNKHHVYAQLNIGLSVLGALLLIVLAPWIIRLVLGDEFEQSISVMRILSCSVVFLAMSYTYGTNYLIIFHKEKQLRNLSILSSLLGMCMAIPLVYYFTYIGAAVTVLLCRGLLGIGSYILVKRIK